jgi:hypothetical protein
MSIDIRFEIAKDLETRVTITLAVTTGAFAHRTPPVNCHPGV